LLLPFKEDTEEINCNFEVWAKPRTPPNAGEYTANVPGGFKLQFYNKGTDIVELDLEVRLKSNSPVQLIYSTPNKNTTGTIAADGTVVPNPRNSDDYTFYYSANDTNLLFSNLTLIVKEGIFMLK
jgi:hypothetical protein